MRSLLRVAPGGGGDGGGDGDGRIQATSKKHAKDINEGDKAQLKKNLTYAQAASSSSSEEA